MIRRLFATPIYAANLGDPALSKALREVILSRCTEQYRHPAPPQGRKPGVFESRFDFLDDHRVEAIRALRQAILTHLQAFLAVVSGVKADEVPMDQMHYHCWFHITESGGQFQPHNHPNASWSAVYCVDPGCSQDSTVGGQTGQLVFNDPRVAAAMHLDSLNRRLHRDLAFDGAKYQLAAGDLTIFPSFLQHFVEPYVGETPRITVAANFWTNKISA